MRILHAILFLLASIAFFKTNAAPETFPDVKDLPVQTNLPDMMTMGDGSRVATFAQWRTRREEMKAILEDHELGHAPAAAGQCQRAPFNQARYSTARQISVCVSLKFGPQEKLGFDIAIFTPAKNGPFPTIINPSFFSTPGVGFTNEARAVTNQFGECP